MVQVGRLVKRWLVDGPPSVDVARPSHCPVCGNSARLPGGGLGLHGHGLRPRTVIGIFASREDLEALDVEALGPKEVAVLVRRYLCIYDDCGSVITVVPRGVRPGAIYTLGAVVFALAVWALDQRHPSVDRLARWFFGDGRGCRGWSQLRRWARRLCPTRVQTDFRPKRRAEVLAQIFCGRAPPDTRPLCSAKRAYLGATRQAE